MSRKSNEQTSPLVLYYVKSWGDRGAECVYCEKHIKFINRPLWDIQILNEDDICYELDDGIIYCEQCQNSDGEFSEAKIWEKVGRTDKAQEVRKEKQHRAE